MTVSQQITDTVHSFVNEIRRLAQQVAYESMAQALGSVENGPGLGEVEPGSYIKQRLLTADRAKGEKRSQETLETLVKRLHRFILGAPGNRIEAIGKSLGVKTKDLVLPVKKLIAAKQILTKGSKRATTYWPTVLVLKKSKSTKKAKK